MFALTYHRRSSWTASIRTMLAGWVCLSLLQIPLPVMHHHTEFSSPIDLAVHVHFRHFDEHQTVDHETNESGHDYHWHLVLPRDLGHPEDCPNETSTPDAAVASGQTPGQGGDEHRIFVLNWDLTFASPLIMAWSTHSFRPTDLNRARLCLHSHVSPAVHACAVLCVFRA